MTRTEPQFRRLSVWSFRMENRDEVLPVSRGYLHLFRQM